MGGFPEGSEGDGGFGLYEFISVFGGTRCRRVVSARAGKEASRCGSRRGQLLGLDVCSGTWKEHFDR